MGTAGAPGLLDQFILKETEDAVELLTEAPDSGIWSLSPGEDRDLLPAA